jgi:hypothetical protein
MAHKMTVQTEFHPTPRGGEWTAVDYDTYDGAVAPHLMGWGKTEQEAIEDLERLFEERAEYYEDKHFAEYEKSHGGKDD